MFTKKTALLLVDLQNDFIHSRGAYGRAGKFSTEISILPETIAPLAIMFRKLSYPIISTQFTLVPDEQGEPMIAEHLKKIRPFLSRGDFAIGSWGNQLVDELGVPRPTVRRVARDLRNELLEKIRILQSETRLIVSSAGTKAEE